MDQIGPIFTAVFAANFFTIIFVYSLYQLRNVYDDRDAKMLHLIGVIVPCLAMAGGVYLYA